MIAQPWCCTRCGLAGEAQLRDGISVHTAIDVLKKAHRELSPGCGATLVDMRVRNPQLCSDEQWDRTVREARENAGVLS